MARGSTPFVPVNLVHARRRNDVVQARTAAELVNYRADGYVPQKPADPPKEPKKPSGSSS